MSNRVQAHKGACGSLLIVNSQLVSGGADGEVKVWAFEGGLGSAPSATHSFGAWIGSLDAINENQYLVGDRSGRLTLFDGSNKNEIARGHSVGETWGLYYANDSGKIFTSGDDN